MLDSHGFLQGRTNRLGSDLADASRQIDFLTGRVRGLERINGELDQKLCVEQSMRLGIHAQLEAVYAELKKVDPNNKLFQASGEVYRAAEKKGKVKSFLRRVFEQAFDKAARERRISNPAVLRGD